ncbi:MAG: SDR family oxidoreductase [Anaerolineae bacterium]|nr:SDR family oxidoreductase [Anaerolineae bacterium]
MFNFSGKKVLLAGKADSDLAAVGKMFSDAGEQVIVADASRLWRDVPHQAVTLDILDPELLVNQIAQLGDIDILVINAGWRWQMRFLDDTPDDWDDALSDNFESPVFLAQAVARNMIARGQGGRIIFLIGVEGLMPFAGTAAAGVSLTMLWGIAKMMAVDLAPHGVTVNLVASSWTNADGLSGFSSDVQAHINRGIPVGRPGTPSDVGAAVAFLASDAAVYITGMVIPVDGGYLLTGSPGQTMFEP